MTWLLTEEVARAMCRAEQDGLAPTAEQQQAFIARSERESRAKVQVADRVAVIDVVGVLTPAPSLLAALFGGGNTTYTSIREALAEAQADPKVASALLNINSPGGSVDGLFETLAALETFSKPLRATATMACSAAYAIATAAGKIEATNAAARFGSIGVAASFQVADDVVDIASTHAPKKRPDVSTPEGQAVVREFLDSLHDLFVDAIARGRRTTKARVNKEFGQGATLLAGDAQRLGMIDSIAKPQLRSAGAALGAANAHECLQKGSSMTNDDLPTLRMQYPSACAALIAEGERKERDRVNAHLKFGEQAGDLTTAVKAIRDGAEMTQEMIATYLTAGMNRAAIRTRQMESDAIGSILDNGRCQTNDSGKDMGDLVVERMLKERGKWPPTATSQE